MSIYQDSEENGSRPNNQGDEAKSSNQESGELEQGEVEKLKDETGALRDETGAFRDALAFYAPSDHDKNKQGNKQGKGAKSRLIARICVDNNDGRVLYAEFGPGMSGNIDIQIPNRNQYLSIPFKDGHLACEKNDIPRYKGNSSRFIWSHPEYRERNTITPPPTPKALNNRNLLSHLHQGANTH